MDQQTDPNWRDHGAVMRGLAYNALETAFADEWIKLDAEGQRLVAQDFLDASEDESLSAREYRDRIGARNLESYAACMRVRMRKGW